jgi:hypothetical protein
LALKPPAPALPCRPPPFSQRHNSFLQRYISTGEARILGSVRSVVAVRKDRSVFPVSIMVNRIAGAGVDQVRAAGSRGGGGTTRVRQGKGQ